MSWRYRKRISIFPGLRVNLSKSGASVSVGHRGFWYTASSRGRRLTAGIPGSGLFWTQTYPPAPAPHAGHRLAFAVLVVAIVALAVWLAA